MVWLSQRLHLDWGGHGSSIGQQYKGQVHEQFRCPVKRALALRDVSDICCHLTCSAFYCSQLALVDRISVPCCSTTLFSVFMLE